MDSRPAASIVGLDEGLVDLDGQRWYAVPNCDRIAPFLMSLVSPGDAWMFVSSAGPLTAGRGDVNRALFPYETDDRLHAAVGTAGPATRIRVLGADVGATWRPFTGGTDPNVRRALAKSVVGDSVSFEEHHAALGLTFRYRWAMTEQHGFVRTASVVNSARRTTQLELIDGVVGVLPYGLAPTVYQRLSNLANAYRRSELIEVAARLAVYSLEAPVSDQAEPEEVLRATAIWSVGLDGAAVTLDSDALTAFDRGRRTPAATLVTGRPGAYLISDTIELEPGRSAEWTIVGDVALDQGGVVRLRSGLRSTDRARRRDELARATQTTTRRIQRITALADAQQLTGDPIECAHHVANVTFNVMRGGVPFDGYRIDTADFATYLRQRNRRVAQRHRQWLSGLAASVERCTLLAEAEQQGDVHLTRLSREYLPLSFSRRHGDPSRPWNAFSIRVGDDDGNPIVYYEGNWRDVFQNWEALCCSFPDYLPGVVTMFLNASTADGHNPYRVSREGIDWEVPNPDDPWANIGYWGDHQVVYLLRLLKAADRYLPGAVSRLIDERCCTFADVPYRIAGFDEMLLDPRSTIRFDAQAAALAEARVAAIGGDGKLLPDGDGMPLVVTMLEKLLIAALGKLSNFVPFGGIWMNTQRPEWNDANNALVGHGLSMVTACHLRAFLVQLRTLVAIRSDGAVVSSEVADWLLAVCAALRAAPIDVAEADRAQHRLTVMEKLGRAATSYRTTIYESGWSGATTTLDNQRILELCQVGLDHLDATIGSGWRSDRLLHSYNLLSVRPDGVAVEHLPAMLEGQVAVLDAGVLTPDQQADLVDALFESALYRPDQNSFLLTPVMALPSFVEKNVIARADIDANPLLMELVALGGPTIVVLDADGNYRFGADLTDAAKLVDALDRLERDERWSSLVRQHRPVTLDCYERVFRHRAYLGRSASMYAYEGIGSIYWHMVTKLLIALQDAVSVAADASGSGSTPAVTRLAAGYERVRAGLGVNKSAAEFGAIPIDPHSHTPAHAGAQQPGMTGAVKEQLLARPRELGVRVLDGQIAFDQLLMRRSELLDHAAKWSLTAVDGRRREVALDPGTLGLTVCQVPVVVEVAASDAERHGDHLDVRFADGRTLTIDGSHLGHQLSSIVFSRSGEIELIRAVMHAPPPHPQS